MEEHRKTFFLVLMPMFIGGILGVIVTSIFLSRSEYRVPPPPLNQDWWTIGIKGINGYVDTQPLGIEFQAPAGRVIDACVTEVTSAGLSAAVNCTTHEAK